MAGLSAKTAWNLRKKLLITLVNGQATASFTGSNKLLGGDINTGGVAHDNRINAGDITTLNANYGPGAAHAAADIDGSGSVNAGDISILNRNYSKIGDPQ